MKQSVDKETIRIFWHVSLENRRRLIASLLFPLGAIFLYTLVPLFVGKMVAALAHPGQQTLPYLPQLIIVAVIGVVTNRIGFQSLMVHQARTISRLENMALETLLSRSVGFHNNNVGGKLVTDALDFSKTYSQLSGAVYATILPFMAILIAGSIIVFSQSVWLGLIIAGMAAYAFIGGAQDSRRRHPLRQRRLKATKLLTGHMADTIVNLQTVKTFAREPDELQAHRTYSHALRDLRISDWSSAARSGNSRIATLVVVQIAFVCLLSYLARHDATLLSVGIFSLSFTTTIFNRMFDTFTTFRTIEEALLQASPMTQTILQDVEVQDRPGAPVLQVTHGRIDLIDVNFAYSDNQNKAVFSQLNLHIKAGERIGLVGPSGGGKSTLTRLLLRFEDIDSGKIVVDEQNIAEVTQASLRQAIAYVPQEPLLFHRTVAENIAYGKPDATLSDITKAAKLAHADDFISELSDGYDTIVGERGVKLSGGQRQRIAIARAILKNAPILILDEATSALDSESEQLIQDALSKLMQGRTTVVVAHRLSTIHQMDRILVLDRGRITEQGSHRQLLRQKGLYAKLWARQSGGFIEE